MEEILIGLAVMVCIAALGVYMIVSGNPRLLHSYHYANVPAAELPALARETGACILATAVGVALLLGSDILPAWTTVIGVALFVLSIGGMFLAIIRHNGSLISFGPQMNGIPRNRAMIAVVISCIVAVPITGMGVYMAATGDVSLLHSYHYASVSAASLPALALIEGLCMVGLGISIPCCMLSGMRIARKPAPMWAKALMVFGTALIIVSLAVMLLAIPALGGSLSPQI